MPAFRPRCECGCRVFTLGFDGEDIDIVCVNCALVLDPDQAGRVGAGIVLAAKASAERELRSQSLHGELHAPEAQK